jgi:hypothetical protein
MTPEKEKLHDMELHEQLTTCGMLILRVPGGWIYLFPESSCFVPFSNEFSTAWKKEALAALRSDRKVYAIKICREATGMSLVDAKAAVEAL